MFTEHCFIGYSDEITSDNAKGRFPESGPLDHQNLNPHWASDPKQLKLTKETRSIVSNITMYKIQKQSRFEVAQVFRLGLSQYVLLLLIISILFVNQLLPSRPLTSG